MGRKSLANERRAQILEAFYRCISKYGLQNSTIKRIGQEAGVQPSILYHYFRNRDELVEKLIEKVMEDLTVRYRAEIGGCEDPATRLEKAIDFVYGPEMLDKDLANLLYNCIAEVQRKPKIRKSLEKFWQAGQSIISGLLMEVGKTSGLSVAQAREIGNLIFAIQDGLLIQRDIYCTKAPLKKMPQLVKDLLRAYTFRSEQRPEFAALAHKRRVDIPQAEVMY